MCAFLSCGWELILLILKAREGGQRRHIYAAGEGLQHAAQAKHLRFSCFTRATHLFLSAPVCMHVVAKVTHGSRPHLLT